ncbi:hypothetical protein Micbo1qcDRAFT_977 [Microdochium bolleyi]|uniref:Uncharacterized protein n=1 Tax=Microdochium bolleyi TaxID=196109 RepID=A0A136JH89_9PEZI|nr:hypothetical protein Micbo1qcDRAFT_977 [Microdochium bolleyi]
MQLPIAGRPCCFEFLRYKDSLAGPEPGINTYSDSETGSLSTTQDVDLRVRKDGFWCYCGPVLTGDGSSSIPSSLDEWCASTLSRPLSGTLWPFLVYASVILKQHGLQHYWISVRATRANVEFDMARWHTDDLFFSREEKSGTMSCRVQRRPGEGGVSLLSKMRLPSSSLSSQPSLRRATARQETDFKLCTTLRGPSTRFIAPEHQAEARSLQASAKQQLAINHTCVDIRCVGCASTAEAVRIRLATDMAELGWCQAAGPGECVFFRLGPDCGAVHSEPPQAEDDRVFVNVVPGTEAELRGLMTKWGMEFPRSWGVVKNGAC